MERENENAEAAALKAVVAGAQPFRRLLPAVQQPATATTDTRQQPQLTQTQRLEQNRKETNKHNRRKRHMDRKETGSTHLGSGGTASAAFAGGFGE